MEKELRKTNSLLNFYHKENVGISFKIKSMNHLPVRGKITKKNLLGDRFVVVKGRETDPIKVFIEDIEWSSIIPLDYVKKENKKTTRTPLPAALRYKILKRDRHTCKSCGARAPDVELEVDHIIPVSKGGTDDEKNLTTKCKECNRGKSNTV